MLGARHVVFIAVVSVLSAIQATHAQSPAGESAAGFLGKDEVQKLVVGKTVRWNRARDNASIIWGINEDRSFNSRAQIAGARGGGRGDSGTWELQDNGGLCMKFSKEGDRPCVNYFFKKQDEKYIIYLNRTPDASALGEVDSIK